MPTSAITGRQIATATVLQGNLGLVAAVNPTDAVILSQLTAIAASRAFKAAARVALLATDFTFSSFASNTITTTASFTTGNGVTLVVGDRVLITTLTGANTPYNGIYTYTSTTGTSQLSRSSDANTANTASSTDLNPGTEIIVFDGTTTTATKGIYYLSVPAAGSETITLNTSNINWIDITPPSATVYTQITRETPSGTLNGSNTAFTLAQTLQVGSEELHLNGQLLDPGAGNDYTISGQNITMLVAPVNTDKLRCSYLH